MGRQPMSVFGPTAADLVASAVEQDRTQPSSDLIDASDGKTELSGVRCAETRDQRFRMEAITQLGGISEFLSAQKRDRRIDAGSAN